MSEIFNITTIGTVAGIIGAVLTGASFWRGESKKRSKKEEEKSFIFHNTIAYNNSQLKTMNYALFYSIKDYHINDIKSNLKTIKTIIEIIKEHIPAEDTILKAQCTNVIQSLVEHYDQEYIDNQNNHQNNLLKAQHNVSSLIRWIDNRIMIKSIATK